MGSLSRKLILFCLRHVHRLGWKYAISGFS
jgi:hypothetical protein